MKRTFNLILFFFIAVPCLKAQTKALFVATPNKGCSPASIKFTDQSTGTGLTYFWDLGNGNTSTLKDPKAIYYAPGFYTVKLIVKDNKGKKDSITKTKYVEVFKNPIAYFDAKSVIGCNPFDPELIDKSTRGSGMITQWTWDYGDGTVKNGQAPSYAYTTEGVYSISLIIKDANGCQSDTIKKNYITAKATPSVIFSVDKTTSCSQPFTVNFTNKSAGLKTGDQFEWDFGDGTKSTSKDPKKTYTDTGSFSVSLTVKAANGCDAKVQIKNLINISRPRPLFNYHPDQVCENTDVKFFNTSTPASFNLLCTWDFGDGNTAKGYNVTNKYKKQGTYNVKLTVTLPDGSCKETLTIPNAVTVLPKPDTKFTISDTIICKPGYMDTLIDKTVGVVSRTWYIDSNVIPNKTGIIYKIKKTGYTSVTLETYNGACYDKLTKFIYKDSLIPNIGLDRKKGCKPLKVKFSDLTQSMIPITSRFWDLGDGNYQNQETFEHTYTKAGIYIVKLTVKTESECTFTSQDTIRVSDKPEITFNFPYTVLCNNDSIKINTGKIKNGQKLDSIQWFIYNEKQEKDTNDVFDSLAKVRRKIKMASSIYNIKLVVETDGCYDTFIRKNILRILPPYLDYALVFDSCKGYPFTLINKSDSADEIRWVFKDTVIKNKDTIIIKKGDKWPLHLWGTNYKSGCIDTMGIEQPSFFERLAIFFISDSYCAPANLTFANGSNYTNYIWKWGDGTKESNNNEVIKKLYQKPGNYKIRLIGSVDNGCKDSFERSITINGPKLSSEVSPKSGCGPLQLRLISKTQDVNTKNKFWYISGLPSIPVTADTMYYTLKKPGPLPGGKYIVTLSMQDQQGCIATSSDTVKVLGVNYHFNLMSLSTCGYPKLTLRPIFNETSLNTNNLNYYWDLGDGRKSNQSILEFSYNTGGTYKVTLKMVDESGCVTERDTLINNNLKSITAGLIADNLDADCPPLLVNFTAKSRSEFGKIVSYLWDFGDGSTSNLVNPSHVYVVAGKFTVTLKVTDDLGCTDKIIYKDLILINGPIGTYTFDKKSGCTPLFVNFNTIVSNTYKLEWDMADGVIIEDSLKAGHLYTRVGKYIPLLVLADSFGCKYTLPPIDTINVFPIPIAQFKYSTPCLKQPIYFTNTSNPLKGKITRCEWDFGDGDKSSSSDPSHTFKTKGTYNVKLKVWNSDNCEAEIIKQVIIKNTSASFQMAKSFYCTGQIPQLINTSQSDTTFNRYRWFLNDTLISKNITPVLPALRSGLFKITLAVTDDFGCSDTAINNDGLIIGDTFPPIPPFIYRVSVETDNSVVLDFNGAKSYDFKQYTIYTTINNRITKFVVSNKADTSKIINSLNTLHNVYCYKVTATNLCGYETDVNKALEHCTVETKASGALKKVDVVWNSYKGWPVNKYEVYREDIGLKGKYDYLATVDGSQLSYIDTAVYCKMTHFYKIKAYENGGHNKISWSDTAAAKPLFANSVPPNDIIRATVDFDKEITIEWTGSGSPRIPIVEYVLEKSEDGINYKWYQSFKPDEFAYTDKKVKVDDKSYFYRTYAVDTCALLSPINNFAKTILLHADTTITERPFVTWSSYQGWKEGVNEYEVQRKKPDGTFVTIGFASANDSMMVDNVTDLNGYPFYCYRVIGYKNMINGKRQIFSISNEDCAPVRSRIFAANAFTINGDNINETFDVKGLYIRDYNIKIFTRWGELVFESNDMNVDWDGYYKGKLCQMDAYIWIIKAIGVDDLNWPMKGTVTIIR